MGTVYLATDPRLERDVALKVLHADPDPGRREEHRHRLRLEARALSRLLHANIATLFDLDSDDGVDFLVLEYVPGQTLAQRLEDGPLPEARARAIALEVAEALDTAHSHGSRTAHGSPSSRRSPRSHRDASSRARDTR